MQPIRIEAIGAEVLVSSTGSTVWLITQGKNARVVSGALNAAQAQLLAWALMQAATAATLAVERAQ
ncbi:MAG: hypothetical protein N2688_01815 [Burkholderiaceae bacterium]|nr:hypothetical protein [Burkholderiaceae bacterium]